MTLRINKAGSRALLSIIFFVGSFGMALAQSKDEKEQQVTDMVQKRTFIFKAQSAQPARGRSVQLTSEYDLRLSGDTLQTYLPFFGRAYSAQPYSGEGGIKITSADFKYNVTEKKQKRWNILIEPKEATGVQQLLLSVTKSGYANLQVISTNRDPISFSGYITPLQ